jgi:hypothetical protein
LQSALKEQGEKGSSFISIKASSLVSKGGCELMKISRSTFYYRGKEKSFEQLKAEADLRDRIEKICLN